MGINLFLVMFRNSTITDLFLFVFTQLILHYRQFLVLISRGLVSEPLFVQIYILWRYKLILIIKQLVLSAGKLLFFCVLFFCPQFI
ncbi:hypothetical protein EFO33_04560 [Lactococcus cremoris]|nr:hypothetical protein [Lactococcus cremoris]MCT4428336.1 hypothetical protein [Lactococcus cremoris]